MPEPRQPLLSCDLRRAHFGPRRTRATPRPGPPRRRGAGLAPVPVYVFVVAGLATLVGACGAGGGSPSSHVASISKTAPTAASSESGSAGSGSPGGPVTSAPSAAQERQHFQQSLKFSECIRSHGITNFPDPGSTGGIDISTANSGAGDLNPNNPQFQAAQTKCREYLAKPKLSTAQQAEEEQSALHSRSACAAHGLPNYPDPQLSANGGVREAIGPTDGVDPNSPVFQSAQNKCSH